MTNLSTRPRSFARRNGIVARSSPRSYPAGRASIAAGVGEQAVLAQEFPERPAVLLHCECGATDVTLVRMQSRREKVMLESLDCTALHRSERLFHDRALLGQVQIRRLYRVAIREDDGARQHVLKFAHIARPRMTEQAVERGEREVFRPHLCDRSLLFKEVVGEQEDIAAAFAQGWKRERQYVQPIE
jgi:hypothetical protein